MVNPRERNSKTLTYQRGCALPAQRTIDTHPPYRLPRYMLLDLPRDVIRSVARFRLCVHTLRFETATWNPLFATCVRLMMPGWKTCSLSLHAPSDGFFPQEVRVLIFTDSRLLFYTRKTANSTFLFMNLCEQGSSHTSWLKAFFL